MAAVERLYKMYMDRPAVLDPVQKLALSPGKDKKTVEASKAADNLIFKNANNQLIAETTQNVTDTAVDEVDVSLLAPQRTRSRRSG